MAKNYKDAETVNPLTPEHLFAELGIDEHRTTVNERDEGRGHSLPDGRDRSRRRPPRMGLAQREQLAAMKKRAIASFGPVTGKQPAVSVLSARRFFWIPSTAVLSRERSIRT
jgi:hypothetical protein